MPKSTRNTGRTGAKRTTFAQDQDYSDDEQEDEKNKHLEVTKKLQLSMAKQFGNQSMNKSKLVSTELSN
jgi:hypothetical protein